MTKAEHIWDIVVRTGKTGIVAYAAFLAAGGLDVIHLSGGSQAKLTALVAAGTALLNVGIKVYNTVESSLNTPPAPPSVPTATRTTTTGPRPCSVRVRASSRARSAEPSCSPWSTVTAPTWSAPVRPSKAVAAASARESAPPLQATRTVDPAARCCRCWRTASLTAATGGAGPLTPAPGVAAPPAGTSSRPGGPGPPRFGGRRARQRTATLPPTPTPG